MKNESSGLSGRTSAHMSVCTGKPTWGSAVPGTVGELARCTGPGGMEELPHECGAMGCSSWWDGGAAPRLWGHGVLILVGWSSCPTAVG